MPASQPAWMVDMLAAATDPWDPWDARDVARLLALLAEMAGALERMHSGYLHDPSCLACAALALYAEGPK